MVPVLPDHRQRLCLTHLSLPVHIIFRSRRLIIMVCFKISLNAQRTLINALIYFHIHSCCMCLTIIVAAPMDSCNLCSVFALCSTGNCAGAVLWHGVCGPAVVGRLPQQICRHQGTPLLYQEAHINHRCTWNFPLLPFNTTDVMSFSCRSTTISRDVWLYSRTMCR